MTISAAHRTQLQRLAKSHSRAELKSLFATIRAHDDRALLAAAKPKKRASKRRGDPLVRDLERTLKPVLGPAAEKADLLVEHIAKKHRRKLAVTPRGLADAARQLRARKFSDDQIRSGAESLVAHLAKLYGERETVV